MRIISLLFCLLLLSPLVLYSFETGLKEIRVGIYQNNPKVFLNSSGKPEGVFIDLLQAIAHEEGWRLSYVDATWSELLEKLERHEIDLLVDVAHTPERAEKFLFNNIFVLESWVDVFALRKTKIIEIKDLDKKNIAVLKDSVQELYLKQDLYKHFKISPKILSYPDYPSTIQAVLKGEADALVATRFFLFSSERAENLVAKNIVFNPSNLYFAFPKNTDPEFIAIFDRHLAHLKNDPYSIYYRSLQKWFNLQPRTHVPYYVKYILVGLALTLVLAILFTLLLKRQVNKKATEILTSEKEKQELQTKLHATQKMESLGRLAGGVAHDFNNMLAVIFGHCDMALKKLPPDSPVQKHIDAILNAAQRSARIIKLLLTFAKKEVSEPVVMKLNESISESLGILQKLVGEDIEIEFIQGSDLWMIKADPAQMDQILVNLCVNAKEAIKHSGKILIETKNIPLLGEEELKQIPQAEYVLLEVSDNGSGMDEVTLKKIFEPFFTTKVEGTGLGLPTVYGIVAQNKGAIFVDSAPGRGTRFSIFWPKYS